MKLTLDTWTRAKSRSNVWLLPVFDGEVKSAAARYGFDPALASGWGFTGRLKHTLTTTLPGKQQALLIGAGPRAEFTTDRAVTVVACGLMHGQLGKASSRTVVLSGVDLVDAASDRSAMLEAVAESAVLSTYDFSELKGRGTPTDKRPVLPTKVTVGIDRVTAKDRKTFDAGRVLGQWTNWARDLLAQSQSHVTAVVLAQKARAVAQRMKNVQCTILGPREIAAKKMGLLQAVNQGSTTPARFIVLRYSGGGPRGRAVCLIGKGLTYDTGGYNLKPGDSMRGMHMDKGGGTAALSAFFAAAELQLKVNLICLVPSTDNRISGTAMVSGDVFTSAAGITVEVDNTDAEGRLILADALAYSKSFKPEYIIDMATLTGAAVVAVGDSASALFCNDDAFAASLLEQAGPAGEMVWRMPLWSHYRERLDSRVADIKNVGNRWGGAITAALFLERFVPEGVKWAHLDIAGRTKVESAHSCYAAGTAYGFGPRLLCRWMRTLG